MAISTFRRRNEDLTSRRSGTPVPVGLEMNQAVARRRAAGQPINSDTAEPDQGVQARESLSGRNAAPSIMDLMNQRREGTGLYSRTNVGTQRTARQQANDAGTFARGVDPQGTLEGRPSPRDVRDPFVDNATRRGIRSGIEDQQELRSDLVSGSGMNPVEYRAGLQALQATNQGLQPLMQQRQATDAAEMQEIGGTNRQLLGIDNTRMQGAMNLAQQAMKGDQQMDLARLQGGLGLDETLLGAMGDREAAAIEGQADMRSALLENQPSAMEQMRLDLIEQGRQREDLSTREALNTTMGEALDLSPEELYEVQTAEGPVFLNRRDAQNLSAYRVGQTEAGPFIYGPQGGGRRDVGEAAAAAGEAERNQSFATDLMLSPSQRVAAASMGPTGIAALSSYNALNSMFGGSEPAGGLEGTNNRKKNGNKKKSGSDSSK